MALACVYGYRECDGCMACMEEPPDVDPFEDCDEEYDRYMDGVILNG